jgi:hypothetical protein
MFASHAVDSVDRCFTLIENEQSENVQAIITRFIGQFFFFHHFDRVFEYVKLWTNSDSVLKRMVAADIIQGCNIEDTTDVEERIAEFVSILQTLLKDTNAKVRRSASAGINSLIEQDIEDVRVFEALVPLVLQSLIQDLHAGDEDGVITLLETFYAYTDESRFEMLIPHAQQVITTIYQIAKAKMNIHISSRAMAIISRFTETYPELHKIPKFVEAMLTLCFEYSFVDVMENWFLDAPKNSIEYYVTCATELSGTMCRTLGAPIMFETLFGMYNKWIASSEPKHRAGAMEIFSQTIRWCKDEFEQNKTLIVESCLKLSKDQITRVRGAAFHALNFWCMGDANFDIRAYFVEFMPVLTNNIAEKDENMRTVALMALSRFLLHCKVLSEETYYKEYLDKVFPMLISMLRDKDVQCKPEVVAVFTTLGNEYFIDHYAEIIQIVKNVEKSDKLEVQILSTLAYMAKHAKESIVGDIDFLVELLIQHWANLDSESCKHIGLATAQLSLFATEAMRPHVSKLLPLIANKIATTSMEIDHQCFVVYECFLSNDMLGIDDIDDTIDIVTDCLGDWAKPPAKEVQIGSSVLHALVEKKVTKRNLDRSLITLIRMHNPEHTDIPTLCAIIQAIDAIVSLCPDSGVVQEGGQAFAIFIGNAITMASQYIEIGNLNEDIDPFDDIASLVAMLLKVYPEYPSLAFIINHYSLSNHPMVRYGLIQLINRIFKVCEHTSALMSLNSILILQGHESMFEDDYYARAYLCSTYGSICKRGKDLGDHVPHIREYLRASLITGRADGSHPLVAGAIVGIFCLIKRQDAVDEKYINEVLDFFPLGAGEGQERPVNVIYQHLARYAHHEVLPRTPKLKKVLQEALGLPYLKPNVLKHIRNVLEEF